MPVIRIVLLLVVLGGLTLLLAQNWSPVLPLVFLGMKTQALPLAIWILISVTAGAITSLLITALFKLSNYFAAKQLWQRRRDVGAAQTSSNTRRTDAPSSANRSESSNTNSTSSDASDWDTDSSGDDDWDFDEDAEKTKNSQFKDEVRDPTNYERQQQPKSSQQSGSVYSYGYREPNNSAVGKTESVYDADYRVIVPPPRQTDTVNQNDDWGFDDDDLEDKGDSPKKH